MTPTDQAHDYGEDAAVEQPAIQLFADLRWETVNLYHEWAGGKSTEGRESEKQVVLEGRLRTALERLNPDLPATAITQVIEEITLDRARMVHANANHELWRLLREGVKVKVATPRGGQETKTARIIDWRNPEVGDMFVDVLRFWLDRGVDGFRLDALNHSMHDPQLRDNPPAPDDGKPRTRPFDFQIRRYNQSHPDVVGFVERIRALCDNYGAVFTMAEVGGDLAEKEMKAYTAGDTRLNSAYGFNFLYAPALTPALVKDTVERWPDEPGMGWPSWAFENHDAPRALSRWCAPEDRPAFARLKMALLMALRGNPILYQGEELGITQVDIPFDQLHDPEAIANWPLTLSRDGARTPMPWEAGAPYCGFTSGIPWLPLGEDNVTRAVETQHDDRGSLLHHTREMIAMRKAQPALTHGAVTQCEARGDLLVLERQAEGETVRLFVNLGETTCTLDGDETAGEIIAAVNGATPDELPSHAALVVKP